MIDFSMETAEETNQALLAGGRLHTGRKMTLCQQFNLIRTANTGIVVKLQLTTLST